MKEYKKYGGQAFYNTKIKSIQIPKSLKECEAWGAINLRGPFGMCSKLSSVTFAEKIEKIPNNLLYGCNGITTITIPNTVTEVGIGAFEWCDNLRTINMTDSVKIIGSDAFDSGNSLKTIYLSNNIEKMENNVFGNNKDIKIYCDKYTYAMKTAIDNDWNVEIAKENYKDSEDKVIVKNQSDYYVKTETSKAKGYIAVTIKYAIKPEKFEELEDRNILIRMPNGIELCTSEIKIDSELTGNYEISNSNTLMSIPVEKQTGTIQICLNSNSVSNLKSYVGLKYKQNNEYKFDIFGVILENIDLLTINSKEHTNSNNIQVTGIAPSNNEVQISVDGVEKANVIASKTGKYSAEITLDDTENMQVYELKATTMVDNKEVEAKKDVQFNNKVPNIQEFVMNYNSSTTNNTVDLLNKESKKVVSLNPAKPLSFEIKFDNIQNLDRVFVTSTRNGIKKKIQADYNSEKKCYVASGYFDKDNIGNYVPGNISYEYSLKHEPFDFNEEFDVENTVEYKAIQKLTDKDVKVTELESFTDRDIMQSAYLYQFLDDTGNTVFKEFKVIIKRSDKSFANVDDTVGEVENVFKYFTKDGEGKEFGINVDFSDPSAVTAFLSDVTGSKFLQVTIESATAESVYGVATDLSNFSTALKTVSKYLELDKDDKELLDRIYNNPNLTIEQKDAALKNAQTLNNIKRLYFMLSTAMLIGEKGAMAFGRADVALTLKLARGISDVFADYLFDLEADTIAGESIFVNWIVDPSGYVYEAVPSNRLEGVKTTIFYKEKEDSEPVLWNATEYEQENPLYTDEDGKYAWDVPEGLWQVKYEKKGYETTYSKWLPVPPPQTDVNIGLISKQTPTVEYANFYDDYIDIKFNKYMKVDTLNKKSILLKDSSSEEISFNINYINVQISEQDELLTNNIRLNLNNNLEENKDYNLLINVEALSYANIAFREQTITKKPQKTPEIIVDNENIHLDIGDSKTINLTIKDLAEGTIKCMSSTNAVSIPKTVQINNGKAQITIKGEINASTLLSFKIEDTEISKNVYVSVGNVNESIIDIDKDTISIAKNSELQLKPILYPTTLDQNFMYSSSDNNIATVDENGTIKGIKNGNITITVSTKDGETFKKLNVNIYEKIDYLLGDVNDDGKVNFTDYLKILSHVKKTKLLTGEELKRADVNNDGKVNFTDYLKVLSHVKKTTLLW